MGRSELRKMLAEVLLDTKTIEDFKGKMRSGIGPRTCAQCPPDEQQSQETRFLATSMSARANARGEPESALCEWNHPMMQSSAATSPGLYGAGIGSGTALWLPGGGNIGTALHVCRWRARDEIPSPCRLSRGERVSI